MGAAIAQIILFVVMAGTVIFLVGAMVRSIQNEKKRSGVRKTFANFGLSIVLVILFFTSWVAQGIAEWQTFVDEQRAHQEPVEVGNFIAQFAQSTLENWQSEFLQCFPSWSLPLYTSTGGAPSRGTATTGWRNP